MKLRFALLFVVIAGCEPLVVSLPVPAAKSEPEPLGSCYQPDNVGHLAGTVNWVGKVPAADAFYRSGLSKSGMMANPNAVTVTDGKLSGAVVFLRGIDLTRSKPWEYPAVRVDLTDRGIDVCQGLRRSRAGFVNLGDAVTFQLIDSNMQGVRVRGDAFFGQILTPQQPRVTRVFDTAGRAELSSASGLYWARADLFVMPHPYITVTDDAGRFNIDNIPAGDYELVVSHPNPAVTATAIDPESSLIVRQTYGPAFGNSMPITVKIGTNNPLEIQFEPQNRSANLLRIR